MPTTTGLATSFITFSRPGASGGGATVTDADGKIKWAGHNLLSNSESFDASAWTKNSTVTANNAASPDGATTAELVNEGTASGYKQIQQNITTAAGVNYTLAIFAKYVSCRWLNLSLFDNNSSTQYGAASFDLQNGVVGNTGVAGTGYAIVGSPTMTPLSGGWYLCSVTVTNGTSVANRFAFSPSDVGTIGSSGLNTYTGASKTFYAWGAHLYRSDLGGMQLNPAQPAGMQSYYPTTPRNLLGYSEDFSNWTQTAATVTADSAIAPNGLQTADKIVATATSGYHARYRTTALGSAKYTISVYAKAAEYSLLHIGEGNFGSFCAAFDLASGTVVAGSTGGSTYVSSAIANAGNGWWRCSIVISNPAVTVATNIIGYPAGATINLYGAQYTGDGTSGIYLWGAQLSDSASLDTYVPQYGAAVTSAAYYAPRLDFDPVTLAARGLLVEEQRTNLLLYTADFRTTAEAGSTRPWLSPAGATTATVNYAEAPDGTTSATRIVFTASDYPGRSQNVTLEASKPYTFSVWIKRVSGSGSGRVQIEGASVISAVSTIDVSTNWTRYTVTGTSTGAGAATVYIYFEYLAGRTGEYLLWGAQIEQGSFATSYIPNINTTAGATRAADVASVSTQAFPYSATEGTIVLAYLEGQNPIISGNRMLSDTVQNRLPLYQASTTQLASYDGTNTTTFSSGALVAGGLNKAAIAWTGTTMLGCVNGGAVASGTFDGSYDLTGLRFFAAYDGALVKSGWIRQLTCIPRRISNAELISRTS